MSDIWALFTAIKKSNFEEPLERDDFVFIHHQNIRFLANETFKVFKGVNPKFVKEIFQFRDAVPYQFRTQTDFQIPSVHSAFSGTESINFLGPKIWEILPHEIKQLEQARNQKYFRAVEVSWN